METEPPPRPGRPPKYVYMMAAPCKGRVDVVLGIASSPYLRLKQQNRELKGGPASTRSRAPHWRLIMVLGPFQSGSHLAREEWKRRVPSNTRPSGADLYQATFYAGLRFGKFMSELYQRTHVWVDDTVARERKLV